MKKIIRVALSFATFADDQLNSFAILVIACLKTNPLFPTLPVTIATLTAFQTAFQTAITDAAQGGPMDTAVKNEARDALVSALRQCGAYVQSLALANLSDVLSSGFDVVNTNTTPSPLDQPLFTLDNSTKTQLTVNLSAVPNAKAYQVQSETGTGNTWTESGIYPNTKGIVLDGLTPGTTYSVRIRAIGGSTQYSDWSVAVSAMAN